MPGCEVVILAGGFGSRLKSVLGESVPKPLALINGVPLIEHQVLQCKKYGFKRILILLHHLPTVIIEHLGDGSNFDLEIEYSIEEHPRGTAGAIFDSLGLLASSFLVIYGDTFFGFSLHQQHAAAKIIVMARCIHIETPCESNRSTCRLFTH